MNKQENRLKNVSKEKLDALVIDNFKDELLFNLSLERENKLTEDVVTQLEYAVSEFDKFVQGFSDDEDIGSLCAYRELAKEIMNKYDNEKLVKKHFYVSTSQLAFLDEYSKKIGLKGKGQRSLALRTILNEFMNNEKGSEKMKDKNGLKYIIKNGCKVYDVNNHEVYFRDDLDHDCYRKDNSEITKADCEACYEFFGANWVCEDSLY